MISLNQTTFAGTIDLLSVLLREAPAVRTERWQGVAANNDTRELLNVNFEVPLDIYETGMADLDHWAKDIKPNREWADAHFQERVGGQPLNPGETWRQWPYALRADRFRTSERFNHSYMERLWPMYARRTEDGKLPNQLPGQPRHYPDRDNRPKFGIAHGYGDLQSLVELIALEPFTRQAWIPLFFPEDTGKSDGGRKVCTLGYQLIQRDGQLHIWYPLRSCDFIRHFRDDCYLAIRLLYWVIDQCQQINPDAWMHVVPGTFQFHATSLHVFESDVGKF
jgi:thymidylate synthase